MSVTLSGQPSAASVAIVDAIAAVSDGARQKRRVVAVSHREIDGDASARQMAQDESLLLLEQIDHVAEYGIAFVHPITARHLTKSNSKS